MSKPNLNLNRSTIDALGGEDVNEAARTPKQKATKRKQKSLTFRIPGDIAEDVITEVDGLCEEMNMVKNDLMQWLFFRGLAAIRAGERPKVQPATVKPVMPIKM